LEELVNFLQSRQARSDETVSYAVIAPTSITPNLPTLDDLLSSIPDNFQYPDDVTDFIKSEPIGQEMI
jgi:hypothetical protein